MKAPIQLRLLAKKPNEVGDLFTRLVKHVFSTLGYDKLCENINKTGREIDISGEHRTESRKVIAECKAWNRSVGGDKINKFLGVLTREQAGSSDSTVVGYYISLNGFTESAIAQEQETKPPRVILLDGSALIKHLERAGIVSRDKAIEQAGRCCQQNKVDSVDIDGIELLGHQLGYVWAVYYTENKQPKFVIFIHADGTPLAKSVAKEITKSDTDLKGTLHTLKYLASSSPAAFEQTHRKTALEKYRNWIDAECGFIQLDGLPADAELSAVRKKLERLFVPLKCIYPKSQSEPEPTGIESQKRKSRESQKQEKTISISYFNKACKQITQNSFSLEIAQRHSCIRILWQCLFDEVSVTSKTLRTALREAARFDFGDYPPRDLYTTWLRRAKTSALYVKSQPRSICPGWDSGLNSQVHSKKHIFRYMNENPLRTLSIYWDGIYKILEVKTERPELYLPLR